MPKHPDEEAQDPVNEKDSNCTLCPAEEVYFSDSE
jgi:hypothetical protein